MNKEQAHLVQGVWPVMLTPFTESGEVDYTSLERLVEWYEENGVQGLFATCQSSEVFCLSLEERMKITQTVVKRARIPVIASGHVSYGIEDQKEELRRMADTGVNAVILITNRMAQQDESSRLWRDRLEQLVGALPPEVPLGFYECSYPYKRLLTEEELSFCAQTGRFRFLKDTCCDLETLHRRLQMLKDTPLKLYNANSASLLESLRSGGAGFSGVMANFHPRLYVWLCENWEKEPEKAAELQGFLTMCSYIESRLYPVNFKRYLVEQGVLASDYSRAQDRGGLTPLIQDEVRQLELISKRLEELYVR